MNQLFNDITIKSICAACCTAASWLVGGYDAALTALFVLMLFDFTLGLILALRNGSYRRGKFLYGIAKFFIYFVVVGMANMVDTTIVNGEFPSMLAKFREFMVFFLAVNEYISISKHLAKLNIYTLPKNIIERLETFRDHYDPISGRMDYGHGAGQIGYGQSRFGNQSRPFNSPVNSKQNPITGPAGAKEEDLYG